MFTSFRRIAVLRVPRSALARALPVGGPLVIALIAVKLLKLAAANRVGIISDNLLWAGFEFIVTSLRSSTLTFLIIAPFLTAWLSSVVARLAGQRKSVWISGALAVYVTVMTVCVVLSATGSSGFLLLAEAGDDLLRLEMLWWREVLIALSLIAMLSGHFVLIDQKPAPVRSVVIWSVVTVLYLLVGLDLAYFVVTHSSLSVEELLYALRSPASGLVLARDSISIAMVLALLAPLTGLALALEVMRRRSPVGPPLIRPGRTVRFGVLFWPVIGITCVVHAAAPAAPANMLADNLLTALPIEGMFVPLKQAIRLRRAASPSARVPVLNEDPVALARTPRTERLNVVIVLLESARADATSVYSPELDTTPYLAELARESVVVDEMYAVSPRSSAARLATLSGQYPPTADVENRWAKNPQRRALRTSLPALLRTEGYTSAYLSSATLRFENDAEVVKALQFDATISRENMTPPASGYSLVFGYEDRELLAPLGNWLDERVRDEQPFLLTLVTNVGHYPYGLPPGFARRNYAGRNATHVKYLNCMRYIDDYLRDVVATLRDRNLLEHSVVLVLGDHGEEFYEHGTYIRGHTLYDTALRIPMLIRFPQSAGRVGHVGGLRQQIDVLPTVADALGFELRGGALPGRSMLTGRGHDVLFFNGHQPGSVVAMRAGNRKYIYSFEDDSTSVFDLDREPEELTDVQADVPAATVRQAESDLHAWQSRVASTF